MKLSDYAHNFYSQFGEDGMITEIFDRIGAGDGVCVEFGAADGVSCSNTKLLREGGWMALLIESDLGLYDRLAEWGNDMVRTVPCAVTPGNIDQILADYGYEDPDFMSIDVDGDDYAIWEAMRARPRVVCIEYNQSIPPHVDLRQAELGDCFGASASALLWLGIRKGYYFVGMTSANMLFVDNQEDLGVFDDLEKELDDLFDYSALTYVVTDNRGRPAVVGNPPWGWHRESYLRELNKPVRRLPIDTRRLFDAYDEQYGPGVFLSHEVFQPADGTPPNQDRLRIEFGPPIVGLDTYWVGELERLEWIKPFAEAHGYRFRMDPGLITLIKE